jgi:hypothetical protein
MFLEPATQRIVVALAVDERIAFAHRRALPPPASQDASTSLLHIVQCSTYFFVLFIVWTRETCYSCGSVPNQCSTSESLSSSVSTSIAATAAMAAAGGAAGARYGFAAGAG